MSKETNLKCDISQLYIFPQYDSFCTADWTILLMSELNNQFDCPDTFEWDM